MNCKNARDIILTDYIDGDLKVRALGGVEEHLKACPACRGFAEDAKKSSALFKNPIRKDPPPEIWSNIRTEISRKAYRPGFIQEALEKMRYILPNFRPAVVAISAAVVLLVAAAAVRFVSIGNYAETIQARDDIIAMVSINGNADESESGYDLGTPAEVYFL